MLEISEPGDKIGEKLLMLLNARQQQVWVGGQVVELTAKEFDILALLITYPQRVFTYELIMELVWNEDYT